MPNPTNMDMIAFYLRNLTERFDFDREQAFWDMIFFSRYEKIQGGDLDAVMRQCKRYADEAVAARRLSEEDRNTVEED